MLAFYSCKNFTNAPPIDFNTSVFIEYQKDYCRLSYATARGAYILVYVRLYSIEGFTYMINHDKSDSMIRVERKNVAKSCKILFKLHITDNLGTYGRWPQDPAA